MGRKGGSGVGWLLLMAVGVGWCSSREAPPPSSERTAIQVAPRTMAEPPREPSQSVVVPKAPEVIAPLAIAPVPAAQTLYTTANVRLREGPTTDAAIVWTAPAGSEVRSVQVDGLWHYVTIAAYTGWMHGDFLAAHRPAQQRTAPSAPAPLVRAPTQSRAGQPVRSPYVGRCDCPYDVARNGSRCGGRSAYSRPGGRSPVCYH